MSDHHKRSAEQRQRDTASAKKRDLKCQALSLPGAENHGMPWQEWEDEIVRSKELTHLEIALKLHRTYFAINDRVSDLAEYAAKGVEPDYGRGYTFHSLSRDDQSLLTPVINPCTECFCSPCAPDCENA